MGTEVATDFAILFRGGKVALDDAQQDKGFRPGRNADGGFQPADDKDSVSIVDDHLNRGPSIGVYPLFHMDDDFWVYWGCVDWDTGPQESFVHARNVREVLHQLDVTAWIERSRSKGFHLWVFFDDAMPAHSVREGLMAACGLVDAPPTEVNPKQVELSARGWGNGVRLPYGKLRQPGGYNEIVDPDVTLNMTPVEAFVRDAMETRVTSDAWEAVTALWRPPERPVGPAVGDTPYNGYLEGVAGKIRRAGPTPSSDKPRGDRSTALFKLACAMARQGYSDAPMLTELQSADIEWGRKYADRPDAQQRLESLIDTARNQA